MKDGFAVVEIVFAEDFVEQGRVATDAGDLVVVERVKPWRDLRLFEQRGVEGRRWR